MTSKELTDNLTFLSALRLLGRLAAKGLITSSEQQNARRELEKKLRPTLLLA